MTNQKGFTLLELLIVITIIAVLSVTLIVVINPAETLRKARDTQRVSDLSSIKTAVGIYLTTISTPYLAGDADNTECQATTGTWASGDMIFYSLEGTGITDATLDGGSTSIPDASQVATAAELGEVDGTGWLPVDLAALTGGSPISNFPIDPTNTVTDGTAVDYEDLVYRYACAADNMTFELNARFESVAFKTTDDRDGKDGGDNTELFEIGSALNIMGYDATDGNEH